MSVTTDEAGAVIGLDGRGIETIRELSKARVEVSKRKEKCETENRVIKLEGEENGCSCKASD